MQNLEVNIHKFAVVDAVAKLGKGVSIGPFTTIEKDVEIGSETIVFSNVLVSSGATVGSGCKIYHGAVLATPPQDLKYAGEPSKLKVGNNTIIREFATLNRGTHHGGGITNIGSNCMLMAYSHVAHDCQLGDHVVIANVVNMAGHVVIGNHVSIGGMTVIHQFVKIGEYAFIGGKARISQDVPPYILTTGEDAKYYGPNVIGLRRKGFTEEQIKNIKKVYHFIYLSKMNLTQAKNAIKSEFEVTDVVENILNFIELSERGLVGR